MTASSSSVRSSLWFVPVMCVLAGVVVSIGTIAIDRWFDFDAVPRWLTGGPDAAVAILETIAVSMVSLATLVLTITMVVVQLAMGQFSPRIVQTFLQDRPSQLAIGLFVATFAHAMLTIREVQFDGDGQVPGVAILVGYVLVLTSIAMLVLYVHHIGQSLRVSALIELVGYDTRRLLDPGLSRSVRRRPTRVRRHRGAEIRRPRRHRSSSAWWRWPRPRVVCSTWCPASASSSRPGRHWFESKAPDDRSGPSIGDRRAASRGWSAPSTRISRTASGCSSTWRSDRCRSRRSPIRRPPCSASTGFTTGCVSWPPDGSPTAGFYDDSGELRSDRADDGAGTPTSTSRSTKIRLAGAQSPQVARRLRAALDDLLDVAPAERRPVLEQQRGLLHQAVDNPSRR